MVVAGFILRRSAAAIVVLVGLSILIFVVARIIPGDPARMALGFSGDAGAGREAAPSPAFGRTAAGPILGIHQGARAGRLRRIAGHAALRLPGSGRYLPGDAGARSRGRADHGAGGRAARHHRRALPRHRNRQYRSAPCAARRRDTELRVGRLPDAAVELRSRPPPGCGTVERGLRSAADRQRHVHV